MDLVAFQLGVFECRGETDRTSRVIDLGGNLETLFQRVPEQGLHHLDDVLVGVIIIIPEQHLVARLAFGFSLPLLTRDYCRYTRIVWIGRFMWVVHGLELPYEREKSRFLRVRDPL